MKHLPVVYGAVNVHVGYRPYRHTHNPNNIVYFYVYVRQVHSSLNTNNIVYFYVHMSQVHSSLNTSLKNWINLLDIRPKSVRGAGEIPPWNFHTFHFSDFLSLLLENSAQRRSFFIQE